MEYQGLNFVEAVNDLAARVGMQVPTHPTHQVESRSGGSGTGSQAGLAQNEPQDSNTIQELIEVMDIAARFYRHQLKSSKAAIDYLKKRGLTGETAARFGIGYAPADWHNLDEAFHKAGTNFHTDLLVSAGLVIRNDEGKCYSRFRDRIMFPILNLKGKLAGFGGRVLGEGEPKYLNSPETPLFQKGRRTLQSLWRAKGHPRGRESDCRRRIHGRGGARATWH